MPPVLAQITTTAPATKSWTDLSVLDWNAMGLEVRVGLLWLLLFGAGLAAVRFGWPLLRRRLKGYRTKSVKISFKGAEVEVCPDHETRRIAYQAWIEIQTRKVGLPFDEEHDVLIEVYNSWGQLFGVLRELCKTVPADCYSSDDEARKLVELLLASLNKGLRPHLTRWQAKLRRWYAANEKTKDENHTPQDIQRNYPHYKDLVADLRTVNGEFVEFSRQLLKLVEVGK